MTFWQVEHSAAQKPRDAQIITVKAVYLDRDGLGEERLAVLADRCPRKEDFIYEERDGMYYGERDGWAAYFLQTDDKTGFCGACFDVMMQDGTTRRIEGPWSSNPQALRAHGFPEVVDVAVYTDPTSLVGSSAAATAAKARQLKAIAGPPWRRT